MTLVPCNISEIIAPRSEYNMHAARVKLLSDFSSADIDCVEVCGYNHSSAKSCSWSLNNSIKTYCITGIKSVTRGNHVYLVKTPALSKLKKASRK